MKIGRPGLQQLQRIFTSTPTRLCLRYTASSNKACTTQRPRTYATIVSAADLKFGQPVHETHPHLLKAGESEYSIVHVEQLLIILFSNTRNYSTGVRRQAE